MLLGLEAQLGREELADLIFPTAASPGPHLFLACSIQISASVM